MLLPPADEQRHPARMSWTLAGRIAYEGQARGWWGQGARVACPMAGEGTELLTLRLLGCEVYGLEIEDRPPATYYRRLCANLEHQDVVLRAEPSLLGGPRPWHTWLTDATQDWPPELSGLDAVWFSPTYESAVKPRQEGPYAKSKTHTPNYQYNPHIGYGRTAGQVGNLTGEAWRAAMRAIYTHAYARTREGGYLVTVTKDTRYLYQRRCLAVITSEDAGAVGWQGPVAWFRAQNASRSVMARWLNRRWHVAGRDDLVINHEDVLVFRKG